MTPYLSEAYLKEYRVHMEMETKSIHLLDLHVRAVANKRIHRLIQQIASINDLQVTDWSWLFYGDGEAFVCNTSSPTPVPSTDIRMYSKFKQKMFINSPFRQL